MNKNCLKVLKYLNKKGCVDLQIYQTKFKNLISPTLKEIERDFFRRGYVSLGNYQSMSDLGEQLNPKTIHLTIKAMNEYQVYMDSRFDSKITRMISVIALIVSMVVAAYTILTGEGLI